MLRIGLAIAGCALAMFGPSLCVAQTAASPCARLKEPVPPAMIGLPTSGATIESVQLVQPMPLAPAQLPFGPPPPYLAVSPATPEYCKVLGSIAPVDPKAPPVRFQVNLPANWNGSSVQFGGGGFNGVLITGLGLPPLTPADQPSPLALGFVTYGTDSGHQNAQGMPLQSFALSDEALINFAYAAYKKVRDVAVVLMQRRYGRGPSKLYYVGFSEGGREGITMAQRFPNDFDGVLSGVPVINWVGLMTAFARVGSAQMGEGWLSPDKVKLVQDGVIAACDQLDGLADGIVSNYQRCEQVFDPAKFACRPGAESACFSRSQLEAVNSLQKPSELNVTLANGIHTYPGWGRGGEAAAGTGPVGGWVSWQTGTAPPTLPPGPKSSRAWLYGSGAVQYFFARDPGYDVTKFTPSSFADRMKEVSTLMDSTDPDLSAFASRGGKLIIYENMADYAQSPYAGIDYYKSVVSRMGSEKIDGFLRLYTVPGADHMGVGAPSSVNLFEVLTRWVEQGKAPGELVQVQQSTEPPFEVTAARPMCRYPTYPHYQRGDVNKTESFQCRLP